MNPEPAVIQLTMTKIYDFVLIKTLFQNKHTKVKDYFLLTNEGEKTEKRLKKVSELKNGGGSPSRLNVRQFKIFKVFRLKDLFLRSESIRYLFRIAKCQKDHFGFRACEKIAMFGATLRLDPQVRNAQKLD